MLLETTIEKSSAAEATWLISVSGELDFCNAPSFRRALERGSWPAGDNVVLDLSGVLFLDSAGLAAIVALHRRLGDTGARLAVVSGVRQVDHMFSVTGISGFIPVAESRGDAIAALAAA